MDNELMKKEMNEAIAAGERALESLRAAQKKLNSAKNWGIYDMLGGGFVASMIKRSKMQDAETLMETAKHDLKVFRKEVQDVQVHIDIKMDISSFLSFSDFFFDNFFSDYLIQSKINNAKEQLDKAVNKVENLVEELKKQMLSY